MGHANRSTRNQNVEVGGNAAIIPLNKYTNLYSGNIAQQKMQGK